MRLIGLAWLGLKADGRADKRMGGRQTGRADGQTGRRAGGRMAVIRLLFGRFLAVIWLLFGDIPCYSV